MNDRGAGRRDRDKILERRRLFVASALAGTVAVHCNPFQPCLSPAVVDSGVGIDAGASAEAGIGRPDVADAAPEADALSQAEAGDDAGNRDAEDGSTDAATGKDAAGPTKKRTVRKSSARPCLIAYVPDDDPFR